MNGRTHTLPLVAVFLTACASSPPVAEERYRGLYEGQPTTVFATEIPAGSAEEAMRRGDSALNRGNLDLALYLYLMAVEMEDTRPEPFYQIGRIHAHRGNVLLATKAYQQVLARAPDHVRALEALGLLLLGERQYEPAERLLRRALAADPHRPRALNGLGVIADLRGDHAGAAEHFDAALAISPESVQTMNNLGYSYYLAGDWARAEQTYRRVLALDSVHALATRNLGLLYARRERYEEAFALLTRVMKPAEAYNDIGYVAMVDGRHEEARTLLHKAIHSSPNYYETAYENLERNEELARQQSAPPVRSAEQLQISQHDPMGRNLADGSLRDTSEAGAPEPFPAETDLVTASSVTSPPGDRDPGTWSSWPGWVQPSCRTGAVGDNGSDSPELAAACAQP